MSKLIVEMKVAPLETLEPVGNNLTAARKSRRSSPLRTRSLSGKVLAVIDSDSPGLAESYFASRLIQRLRETCNLADVIWVKKANRTHPPQPELWQKVITTADIGIAMYGGCGTCSSRTMRDAIEMESVGIPAVAIAHEELRGAVESMRKISNAPNTPYILVTRPVTPNGDWGEVATNEVVERILSSVVAELLDQTPAEMTA